MGGGRGETYTVFLVGQPEGKREVGRRRRKWYDNIKMIFRKWNVGEWTESIWFRIGTGCGHV
jgi:hypothetical protein